MNGRLVPTERLSGAERRGMLALLAEHFHGVDTDVFSRDLSEKNWVILIEDDGGQLRGFSTLLLYATEHEGEPLNVVYSGDTIVHRAAWGSLALPRTWLDAVMRLHGKRSSGRLLWLLITSGFRTYRFLPVFARRFFPSWSAPTPAREQRLIDALARERFGERYDPGRGIVTLEHPQVLRGELCRIPTGKLADPHVAFFEHVNPGHIAGEELVCLTEISAANLTRAGRRMVRAGAERCAASRSVP